MLPADTLTCKIATPDAVKIDLISCTTSLFDAAIGVELMWIGIGAAAAALSAFITIWVVLFAKKAWKTAQAQLDHSRKEYEFHLETKRTDDIRESSAALIRSLNALITRAEGSTDDEFIFIRQGVYEEAMLFHMRIPAEIDVDRFSRLIRAALKAAGLRKQYLDSLQDIPPARRDLALVVRSSFARRLVEVYVSCLLEFGRRKGEGDDLLEALESKAREIGSVPAFNKDPEIREILQVLWQANDSTRT